MTPTTLNPLNGHLWKAIRWVGFGGAIVTSFWQLKLEIAANEQRAEAWRRHVEYRLDKEFVTRNGFRSWRDELELHNQNWEVPQAKGDSR